ncbi:MAG: hypothetical protein AAFO03_12850 [Bacteroidota bacterium]
MYLITKHWTTLCFLALALTFVACEKEAVSTEQLYSTEAQQLFEVLQTAEAEAEVSFGLSIADIEAILSKQKEDLAKDAPVCCYTASDLAFFSSCWGATSGSCLDDWDFNGDDIINTADLLVLLANYGCPEVEAQLIVPVSIFISDQFDGMIRNETLIDGQPWYVNYGTEIFDNVRWYYDGVPVATTPTHLQLEYPGAVEFDAPIACNSGNHLIELYVMVDCEIYSTSACVKLGMDEPLPLCESNYCSL